MTRLNNVLLKIVLTLMLIVAAVAGLFLYGSYRAAMDQQDRIDAIREAAARRPAPWSPEMQSWLDYCAATPDRCPKTLKTWRECETCPGAR